MSTHQRQVNRRGGIGKEGRGESEGAGAGAEEGEGDEGVGSVVVFNTGSDICQEDSLEMSNGKRYQNRQRSRIKMGIRGSEYCAREEGECGEMMGWCCVVLIVS